MSRRLSLLRALLCLAAALGIRPPTVEAQGTAPGPPPPACELLSKADAEAIIGKPLKPLGPLEYGPAQCAYTPVGESSAVMQVAFGGRYTNAAEFYRILEESARSIDEKVERRSDLGEGALVSDGLVWVYAKGRSAAVYSDTAGWALVAARKVVTKLGAP
jgi:hypothetical protein